MGDGLKLSGDAHGDGGDGNDTLTAEGRTSLYGGDGDDMMSGQGTLEDGSGDDRLGLSYERDVSTDRAKTLLYEQADGGDGNDTIIASSGVLDGDTYTTSGTMALNGGAGDDYISASAIYKIDAGSGDDTVSIARDATKSQDHQGVILGEGNDVAVAPVSLFGDYYGIRDIRRPSPISTRQRTGWRSSSKRVRRHPLPPILGLPNWAGRWCAMMTATRLSLWG